MISVDGVLRSRLNSHSRPIHATEEGLINFWKWFGDSKSIDSNGRPIVAYHGTFSDIQSFAPQDTSSFLGKGIYLTDNPQDASRYASDDVSENPDLVGKTDLMQKLTRLTRSEVRDILTTAGGKVYPVFTAIMRPLEITNKGITFNDKKIDFSESRIRMSLKFEALSGEAINLMSRQIDRAIAGDRLLLDNLVGKNGTPAQGMLEIFSRNKATRAIREIAISVGADGIILKDGSAPTPCFNSNAIHVMVMSATQVKSAIGNSGEFNPESDTLCDTVLSLRNDDDYSFSPS